AQHDDVDIVTKEACINERSRYTGVKKSWQRGSSCWQGAKSSFFGEGKTIRRQMKCRKHRPLRRGAKKLLVAALQLESGDSDIFETWDKQIRFLRTTYKLDDSLTKILIGMRLKGRATEWFHSKPEYIGMTADQLLDGLRGMFYHRPNKIVLKRRFEERMWKKNETFHDYVHAKVILANRIALSDDDILEYIIDGISDVSLRDLARVQGFTSRDEMLRAFDEITLRDKGGVTTATSKPGEKSGDAKRKSDKYCKDNASVKGERKVAVEKKECDNAK
ncbi:hypothetical protein DMN91_000006, partial [Ooceraea biroi]